MRRGDFKKIQNPRVPHVGLRTEFRSVKIPRNRLGWFPLFRGRKCSFRGIPNSAEEPIPKLGTEQNGTEFREKIKFYGTRTARPLWLLWHRTLLLKFWAAEFCVEQVSLPRNCSERNSNSLLLYFFHGTEFRVVFSSAEGFGREFWEYSSIFVSTEGNSELFSLLLKCSEGNSESLLLFFFNRNGIPSCFLFRGRVQNGIPRFSVPRNNRNSVGNNHLFRLFRLPRNYFFVGNSQP